MPRLISREQFSQIPGAFVGAQIILFHLAARAQGLNQLPQLQGTAPGWTQEIIPGWTQGPGAEPAAQVPGTAWTLAPGWTQEILL